MVLLEWDGHHDGDDLTMSGGDFTMSGGDLTMSGGGV